METIIIRDHKQKFVLYNGWYYKLIYKNGEMHIQSTETNDAGLIRVQIFLSKMSQEEYREIEGFNEEKNIDNLFSQVDDDLKKINDKIKKFKKNLDTFKKDIEEI